MNMATFTGMNRMAVKTGFFRQRRPRQFHYQPLFYDPKKEAREERLKKIHEAGEGDRPLPYTPSLQRGSFRLHYRTNRRNVHTGSNTRLFIIILLLGLLTWFFLLS